MTSCHVFITRIAEHLFNYMESPPKCKETPCQETTKKQLQETSSFKHL